MTLTLLTEEKKNRLRERELVEEETGELCHETFN